MDCSELLVQIQNSGAQNDLVIEVPESWGVLSYCCKTIEKNRIPGLLPMRHQILDGTMYLKYDLSGKMRIADYMQQRNVSYKNGLRILSNLTGSLQKLGEYFLSLENCLLDTQQLYIGDGLQVYFVYLPLKKDGTSQNQDELRTFYEKLISAYFAISGTIEYDEMFKWVYKNKHFDLESFRAKFLSIEESVDCIRKQPSQIPYAPPVSKIPVMAAEAVSSTPSVIEKHNYKIFGTEHSQTEVGKKCEGPAKKGGVMNIPGGGELKIPVAAEADPKAPKEPKEKVPKAAKEKKEKGAMKSFWLFGKKVKQESHTESAEPNQTPSMPNMDSIHSQPIDPEQETQQDSGLEWGDGTIYVMNEKTTFQGGAYKKSQSAWLEYRGQHICISKTPFLMGKFNSTIALDFPIYQNDKVSRRHASILQQNDRYCLRDESSMNGTFLNRSQIPALTLVPLHDGDEIRLFDETMIFHLE